jgi:phosphate starvation-inducible PhoH-like protein
LDGIEDVVFCQLTSADVVRHRLVAEIIDAYSRYDVSTPAVRDGRRQ